MCPPHRCAVPPWQEAVPSGAGAEDIPLLLLPAWPLSRHGFPCASSSGQKPPVHRLVSTPITEPPREAVETVYSQCQSLSPCSWLLFRAPVERLAAAFPRAH